MYAITNVLLFAFPAAFGSRYALLLTLFLTALLIVRTRLEDRTLHAEPEGYPEYARQIRYRLISGIWGEGRGRRSVDL
jgi:protein-S-isoprenylcysteine O-methyltransferase Ste14